MLRGLLAAAIAICFFPASAGAQPKDPVAKQPPKKVYRGRLPNYYGKIGLSIIQKQEIYKIQSDYKSKLAALEEQIKKMKEERDKKVHDVLTAKQKEWLSEVIKQAKARREEKKKDSE